MLDPIVKTIALTLIVLRVVYSLWREWEMNAPAKALSNPAPEVSVASH